MRQDAQGPSAEAAPGAGSASLTRRVGCIVLGLFVLAGGGWIILTQQLPYVLAHTATDLALRLNPNHPAPLMARAERLRQRLLAAVVPAAGAADGAAAGQRDAPAPVAGAGGSTDELRKQISALAQRIIQAEPFNARAFRLLGEASTDIEATRRFMNEAVKRSRRESAAVFWLMHDSLQHERYGEVLGHADTLLRTDPKLNRYTISYIAHLAVRPRERGSVVEALSRVPPWRPTVLAALPRLIANADAIYGFMSALRQSSGGMTADESAAFVVELARLGRVDLAYSGWLETLDEDRLNAIGFVNNAGFDLKSGKTIFDWRTVRPVNALHAYDPAPQGRGLAFRVVMGPGRIRFPTLSQTLVLGPGRYQLTAKIRGQIIGKRGLYWDLRCLGGPPIARSDAISGTYRAWTEVTLAFAVPADTSCRGQVLSLSHGARSASEELVSGDVWIDDVNVKRIER